MGLWDYLGKKIYRLVHKISTLGDIRGIIASTFAKT